MTAADTPGRRTHAAEVKHAVPEEWLALAYEIARSPGDGLVLMESRDTAVLLGARKTAHVVAALRGEKP